MATLNEDCLERIFAFLTPVEWVHVSQVCRLWKTAVERQWRTITEIKYRDPEANVAVISTYVVSKIVLCAAPFVKILYMLFDSDPGKSIRFGLAYVYNVESFSREKMLKLLQKKSTEITELFYVDKVYDKKVSLFLARIFLKNKIKKLTAVLDGSAVRTEWFQTLQTEYIEKLFLVFKNTGITTGTVEDCFPNLKELRIHVFLNDPVSTLSAILPYISGITSFKLLLSGKKHIYTLSKELLWNITKMTELEELRIDFRGAEVKCLDHFVNELAISCPKLRSVELTTTNYGHSQWNITASALRSLLLFPNLEKLIVCPVEGYGSIILPDMKKLTDFCVKFEKHSTINMEHLCCAVKQMPMLQKLMIGGLMSKEQILQLVFEMVVYAASQGKNVVLFREKFQFTKIASNNLKISRKNVREVEDPSNEQDQTMNMLISDKDLRTYLDDVKAFVEINMKDYETFAVINTKNIFPILW